MPAPVAAPLAAPIAGAAVKGAAQGIGAALRYGPGLLQLADAFRRPGGLGGTVADAPRRQRLAELIADAVAGARLPVALPPSPGFPGPSPLGPLGPLLPWEAAARALVGALGSLYQRWGELNTRERVAGEVLVDPRASRRWRLESKNGVFTPWIQTADFHPLLRVLNIPSIDPSGYEKAFFLEQRIVWEGFFIRGVVAEFYIAPVEGPDVYGVGEKINSWTLDAGGFGLQEPVTAAVTAEAGRYFLSFSDEGEGFEWDGKPIPVELLPDDFVGQPSRGLEALFDEGSPEGLTVPPAVGGLDPQLPPLADALPADPASTDNPEALTAPAPVVPPLPAYVPRPLPGPVLPEFEPEPEADPSRGPGTDRPARPVIPGDRPGPTIPAPVRPFPDVPAEPGVFPDNPPGPGETPNTPPVPGVTPNTPPGPVIDPGVFPQPGPPATPTGPDGNPAVPDTDTTTDTPTDQHTPVAGDDPVTGNGPAPTLQAMAREMGRQEQKLGRLLERVGNPNRPTGPGVDPPSIPDLLGLLRQVLELLGSIDGAGAYEISSPCNVDPATGEPVPPLLAEWGGSVGLERNILKRVDALAELVQHHKDLPQPICRGPRPTGEHVTVNFEQVPDDLEAPA
jgi:hypothetical protein